MTQEVPAPTDRELELEVELWGTRVQSIQNALAAVQAQASALPHEMKQAKEGFQRAQAALTERRKPKLVEAPPPAEAA